LEAFELDSGKWLGKDVGPIIVDVYFYYLNDSFDYLIAKVVELDG